jgi:Na+-transporting NADH:ubiquinone oxidoreductase subunit NqrE
MNEVLKACRRIWRRLGVRRADAGSMVAELEADLVAAESDGTSVGAYVGRDLRGFALEWASARGLVRTRLALGSTALASILGTIPGAFFALFVAYGMSSAAFAEIFGKPEQTGDTTVMTYSPSKWLLLALYLLGAVIAYAGALAAVSVWLSWCLDPARKRTLRYLALGLPFGTVAAVFLTITFASTRNYSTQRSIVLGDAAVAVLAFAFAVVVLRLAAVRQERLSLTLAESP